MVTWCVPLDQQVDVGQDGGGVVLPQLTRQGLQERGALCRGEGDKPRHCGEHHEHVLLTEEVVRRTFRQSCRYLVREIPHGAA